VLIVLVGAALGTVAYNWRVRVAPFVRGYVQQADATRYLILVVGIAQYPVGSAEGLAALALLADRVGASPADVIARFYNLPARHRRTWRDVIKHVL
jgi:hypothetical protein